MPTPHDALFKFTFGKPQRAAAILRTILPPSLAKRIAWGTMKALPTELMGERLDALHTDLLFEVRVGGRRAVLILLFEHQSSSDRWMPLRLLSYAVEIWIDHHRRHPDRRLPAVIPVVLHHGESRWAAARELRELIDLDPADMESIGEHLPNFRFLLDDLSAQADEDLHSRMTHDAIAHLALLLLKNTRNTRESDEQAATLSSYLPLFQAILSAPSGLSALRAFLSYTLAVTNVDRATIESFASKLDNPIAEKIVMTAAERLRQEGRQEGRREGRQEGRKQTLTKQITLRFGVPDAATLVRLEAASEAELDLYAERILTAASVEELLRR